MREQEGWKQTLLPQQSTLQDAIRNLNQTALRIVLVVGDDGRLLGTVSDGDIRRGLLKGISLDSSISEVMRRDAMVVPPMINNELVIQLMRSNKLLQIPIVDDKQRIVGLHVWDEIFDHKFLCNSMVIMAGGKGTRLLPYTESCPKPMVHVAGKPMLHHIIERAKEAGFGHFILAINHLGHMIEEYVGKGEGFGVKVDYLKETSSLGTAGALSLLDPTPDIPLVVTNGDVITDIPYGELLDFHTRYHASATMAVRTHELQHPFGVVQTAGVDIVGFEEKPIFKTHINAGVYVLSPEVLGMLKRNEPCDMPTLFQRARADARRVVAYPIHEPWFDVGRPDDLDLANVSIKS